MESKDSLVVAMLLAIFTTEQFWFKIIAVTLMDNTHGN